MDGLKRRVRAEGRAIVLTLPRAFAEQYGIHGATFDELGKKTEKGTLLEIKPFQSNSFIIEVKE